MQIIIIQYPTRSFEENCYGVVVVDDVIHPEFVYLLELNLTATQSINAVHRRGVTVQEAKKILAQAQQNKRSWPRIYMALPRPQQLKVKQIIKSGKRWRTCEVNTP